MHVRPFLALICLCAGLVACGTSTTAGSPAPAPADSAVPAADGSASAGDCPLAADDLAAATSLTWDLRATEANKQLETLESGHRHRVRLHLGRPPPGRGDPLVLRVDTVTGATRPSCTRTSRTPARLPRHRRGVGRGGRRGVCRRDGSAVEGNITGPDRSVDVYLVNADTQTATLLTPSFEAILSSVKS